MLNFHDLSYPLNNISRGEEKFNLNVEVINEISKITNISFSGEEIKEFNSICCKDNLNVLPFEDNVNINTINDKENDKENFDNINEQIKKEVTPGDLDDNIYSGKKKINKINKKKFNHISDGVSIGIKSNINNNIIIIEEFSDEEIIETSKIIISVKSATPFNPKKFNNNRSYSSKNISPTSRSKYKNSKDIQFLNKKI